VKERQNIVFLYTELAGYFMACIRSLVKHYDVSVHIIRYPVNAEAPFQFDSDEGIYFYDRASFTNEALSDTIDRICPDVILVSGWIDKGYLEVCDKYFARIPTVLLMDNQWKGSVKQRLAGYIDPFKLKKRFSHVWVPGHPQKKYALKFGFKEKNIRTGFYCADTTYFNVVYNNFMSRSELVKPKKFLFIGRYLDFKGIFGLWRVFVELAAQNPEWQLVCMGTGEEWERRIIHAQIKHLGFVQPEVLETYINDASFFVMPSVIEPWGVVLHEMVAAGMPAIVTSEVGSASAFVRNGENGFVIKPADRNALKAAMQKAIMITDEEFVHMKRRSHELSQSVDMSKWTQTILDICAESILSKHG